MEKGRFIDELLTKNCDFWWQTVKLPLDYHSWWFNSQFYNWTSIFSEKSSILNDWISMFDGDLPLYMLVKSPCLLVDSPHRAHPHFSMVQPRQILVCWLQKKCEMFIWRCPGPCNSATGPFDLRPWASWKWDKHVFGVAIFVMCPRKIICFSMCATYTTLLTTININIEPSTEIASSFPGAVCRCLKNDATRAIDRHHAFLVARKRISTKKPWST